MESHIAAHDNPCADAEYPVFDFFFLIAGCVSRFTADPCRASCLNLM